MQAVSAPERSWGNNCSFGVHVTIGNANEAPTFWRIEASSADHVTLGKDRSLSLTVTSSISSQLLSKCFGDPRSLMDLAWLCDNVGGRTSGADSGRQGEEWAHRLLKRSGLSDVRFEEFPVTVWERGNLIAQVNSPTA